MFEAERLAALHGLDVLDTPPEAIFDSLTRLAALTFQTPIALVSLVDADRQWFKSCLGLDVRETSRDVAFCDHAIREAGVMVVLDATQDARFADNPLVTGDLGIRFYAGAPLVARSGHRLGTLCIIDVEPRASFDEVARAQLAAMATAVSDALAMRRDISSFVALERERARDRALLAQAEEMAGVGHWSWDATNDTTSWSPAVYRIHGYDTALPPPDLAGVLAMYHPDDATALAGLVQRAVSHAEPYALNARIIRPDGEVRHVAARGSCDCDETGAVRSLVGTFVDVTDLKLADEKLRANEARLNFLMEQSADLVVRTEPGRGITWVSPSCRLYGYEPEDLVGTLALELVHPDDVANLQALRAARFAGLPDPPGSSRQHRIRHKNGGWIWVQGNPTIIKDAEGQVVEIVNVLRDVTAEQETAIALAAARDAAQAAAQVKTDFMANMSHEIRTPLTAILGYTTLLSERPELELEARTYVSRLNNAGQALLAIVNDILDFSKLEAGQVVLSPKPTPISNLFRDTLLLFAPQADAKGLELDFAVAGELPGALLVDPDKLRQILLNVIGNAVKFTDQGHVRLKTGYDPDGGKIDIWVEDTGPGMTPEQTRKLFQRFSQVDGSSTRRHGGTGLGLAISHGLAEVMGGGISVSSEPERGSTFHIHIPAVAAEVSDELDVADIAGHAVLDGIRVLVIDDNPVNRELARAILAPFGVEISEATSAGEGLALAAELPVDAILLDIRMPEMDGPEALDCLRASDGPNQFVPVLAFTAGSEAFLKQDLESFDGVVAKPMIPADVIAAIHAAIFGDSEEARRAAV
ncbi:PAS domain-containing protein [Phenylobacterium sp.]|uniref:PAS domain-containing protein n=1 Tax=Phenylobacterium sp. TaxID=1871053 RepID=UPI0025EBD18A|nr:PAS domain-containing protein [Phenylobacterium sp.]